MGDTKIIYHIDEEETPYLVKLPIPSDTVTLGDFKNVLNRPSYKFFFKSMDDDFGIVKEEIVDDDAKLPCLNGRVVSWLVSVEGSSLSDGNSQCTESDVRIQSERQAGIGDSRPPSFHPNPGDRSDTFDSTCTETESTVSSRRPPGRPPHKGSRHKGYIDHAMKMNGHNRHQPRGYESSSVMTSDIDATSFFDSDDETTSRVSSMTEQSSVSRIHGRHKRRRRKHKMPAMSRTSSISSITDSTMSLNIITVTLNMDTVNFLGISIVGQSNKGGDGGIYVGSIMKGGAVALDARVEPGDMILQVNDINFENMSNDDAVRVLREAVQKPGPIKLVVAKCWDPNPKGYFTIPRTEPVRPIDPGAWVAHTAAMRGEYPMRPPSVSTLTSTSSSITSSIPESDRQFQEMRLSYDMDMLTIVKAMAAPDSGLDVRDRMWLKITIPKAFIGADVVDWLHSHVDGFADRREARKYATEMLKAGFIRHTVNKITFSEQCYYVFGDLCSSLAQMKIDEDSVSEADRDTLGPLPPPSKNIVASSGAINPTWVDTQPPSYSYATQNPNFAPPFAYTNPARDTMGGSYGAIQREGGSLHSSGSSNGSDVRKDTPLLGDQRSSGGSDSEVTSQHTARRGGGGGNSSGSDHSAMTTTTLGSEHPMPIPVPNRLESIPSDVSGSRQSFRMAMAEDDLLDYQFSDKGVV